jgi:NADH-quinone oxidoreductase subunit N
MVPYLDVLRLALPEVIVTVAALLVLAVDLLFLRGRGVRLRFGVASALGSVGCVVAIVRLVMVPEQGNLLHGVLLANPLTHLVQIVLLVLGVVTLLLAVDSEFTEHVGEYVLLILLATVGMMFLAGTQDLLVLFLSLELLSLSLYVITGFDKRRLRSAEAALKYFLFGGMSAAFLLFGFSLLYGLSNSTNFTEIAAAIHGGRLNPLLVIAMVMTVVGFGFKVAAFPFHFWAPDVYEAAPMPSAAFGASSSKVASFFVFFQIMTIAFAGASGSAAGWHFTAGWVPVLVFVAALSMLFGNLVAIRQKGLRRLLAYSAVAHAGYMLLAIVSRTRESLGALLFYVVTYALATLGIFAVIGVVERVAGSDDLASFRGLSRRAPIASACLFVFLLSLAGIPPLAGFFGKFYLLVAAMRASSGLLWLVVLVLAMSAVSLYYYLQVLKRVYVTPPDEGNGVIEVSPVTQAVMVLLAAGVLLLGCAPQVLLGWILRAIGA